MQPVPRRHGQAMPRDIEATMNRATFLEIFSSNSRLNHREYTAPHKGRSFPFSDQFPVMAKMTSNRSVQSVAPGGSPRYRRLLITVPILILLFTVGYFFSHHRVTNNQSDRFYGETFAAATAALNLQLIDQNGTPFQLAQLHGKAVLFCFGYTHCPDVCPTTLSHFAEIIQALPAADRNRVEVLFITVDPQRDTPEVLKNYLTYFDPAFIGLTGTAEQIHRAAGAYGAAYSIVRPAGDKSGMYFVNHSPFSYCIDPKGNCRLRYLTGQLNNPQKIAKDIELLLTGA